LARVYRLGVACMVHDHVWGELQHWKKLPNVEIVAAADVNQPLLDKIKAEYGVQRLYHSWQEMIEKEELDIIQAASENSTTADIVEAAAAKGIHVVSEKPMSARLSQADRMIAAKKKYGIQLMINWPTAWSPQINTMMELIKDGAIGQPFYFKFRSAHNGPKEIGCSEYFWKWLYDEELNGAGALMDYCCYSADMNAYLFGLPKSVVGIRAVLVKDYPVPDDNAIILMKYDKVFGVAEACWTQPTPYATPNPVAYGTEGYVCIFHNEVRLRRVGEEEKTVEAKPLPEGRRNGPEYLVTCLETGQNVEGMCSAEVSRDAQEILEAGLISANTGKAVELPL
jgi:predicted dehydrogenase